MEYETRAILLALQFVEEWWYYFQFFSLIKFRGDSQALFSSFTATPQGFVCSIKTKSSSLISVIARLNGILSRLFPAAVKFSWIQGTENPADILSRSRSLASFHVQKETFAYLLLPLFPSFLIARM